jgi:hypothetical protein
MPLSQLTRDQVDALSRRRIFFGHQSVGGNIVTGVRALLSGDSAVRLRIMHASEAWAVDGPALIEGEIGRNGDPVGKTRAFVAAVTRGLDEPGAVAFHKYCYVDMTPEMDVDSLFAQYRAAMRDLEQRHPLVTFAHVTMPLATDDASAVNRLIKRALRRDTTFTLNRKRNRFNQLLRREYAGKEPLFDLAMYESTRPDGSRSFVRDGPTMVYTLASENSNDGGHLTPDAERRIGERFLVFLAELRTPAAAVAANAR